MHDVRGKQVVVIGLGLSGRAAVAALLDRGAIVLANDARPSLTPPLPEHPALRLHLGDHSFPLTVDCVVVSPGVPPLPIVDAAVAAGIPVWGEIELATRLLVQPAPIVAIGGTNGKSTVTSLLGALFERAAEKAGDLPVFCGGNLGEPLAPHIDERFSTVILEVSSFQMERVERFRPRAALLLNVSPDHLDRYAGMGDYANAKGNMFLQQTAEDIAIVPSDEADASAVCLAQAKRGGARIVTFGTAVDADVRVTNSEIVDRRDGEIYLRAPIRLQGAHNARNVAAAIAAARDLGVSPEIIRDTLAVFEGLSHRMAFVAEVGGVRFYDDSKGTNVGAAVTALRGLAEAKAVLVAGGRDKQGGYDELRDALADRGRACVVIGEAAAAIQTAVEGAVAVAHAATMDEAVNQAFSLAKPGDAVLLSPACSSFDMFRDYKHRGDAFVASVRALAAVAS